MAARWTSPLVVSTALDAYEGADRLDVSSRTSDPLGRVFAPPAALEGAFLRHRATGSPETARAWGEFEAAYTERMRASLRSSLAQEGGPWQALLARPAVTLVCPCFDPAQCHRSVLAGLLARCGARFEGERRLPAQVHRRTLGDCLLPRANKGFGRRG